MYIIAFLMVFIVALFSYMIGSIPTGYIAVKAKTGQDIREAGSGSIGATNVKRVLGKKWFFIVMLLDAIKGAIPVVLTRLMFNDNSGLLPVIAAACVIAGHSRPVFLSFQGGKSVASGIGTLIALSPAVGLITAAIWAIVTYISKYVSVGSIVAVAISPILMYSFKKPTFYVLYCIIAAIYIIYLHRQNIGRLKNGEENKVRE